MNMHIENDKENAPFLMAASFIGLIKFEGSEVKKGVLYWKFSSKEKAEELILQFRTKTEPHIPAKNIFEATEVFWQQVARAREMY